MYRFICIQNYSPAFLPGLVSTYVISSNNNFFNSYLAPPDLSICDSVKQFIPIIIPFHDTTFYGMVHLVSLEIIRQFIPSQYTSPLQTHKPFHQS